LNSPSLIFAGGFEMALWEKGKSANPAGKPKGTIHKATKARQSLVEHLPEVLDAVVAAAKGGDMGAARLVTELCLPKLRPTVEPVELPGLTEADSLAAKGQAVIVAMADGAIGPDVAAQMLAALSHQGRILEIEQLEERVSRLEQGSVNL
jgi:hypothetical protein